MHKVRASSLAALPVIRKPMLIFFLHFFLQTKGSANSLCADFCAFENFYFQLSIVLYAKSFYNFANISANLRLKLKQLHGVTQ